MMNKSVLIKSLENRYKDEQLCCEVVDATFELLSELVTLDHGLSIEGIGRLGAHERQGANKELPNEEGILAQKNLSIFFHPAKEIKKRVDELVEDVSKD